MEYIVEMFVHYFLVMLHCGSMIHFSQMTSSQDAMARGCLEMAGSFHFTKLQQNFHLEVEIYTMVIKSLKSLNI